MTLESRFIHILVDSRHIVVKLKLQYCIRDIFRDSFQTNEAFLRWVKQERKFNL